MRVSVVAAALSSLLLFTASASGAASFTDAAGDDNAAPDLTSVTVSEAAGTLTIGVDVANYQTLPAESWFNIWFDLDNNPDTGDTAGDEALVRFLVGGMVEHYTWSGTALVPTPATGMSGTFAAGKLTLSVPKAGVFTDSAFGVLAVGARSQTFGTDEFVASDFAPGSGRSAFAAPTPLSVPDPTGDNAAAPDLGQVRVTDARDGWIRFAISTRNRATLPVDSAVVVAVDADNRARTGSAGADLLITDIGGQQAVLQRWSARRRNWADDTGPTRVRARSGSNVVTIEIHGSELGNSPRFGFTLSGVAVDVTAGQPMAVDLAPNNGAFWRYTLANPLRLLPGRAVGLPTRPRAGAQFTVSVPIKRSDTNRRITNGRVTCNVVVGGKRVRAVGRVRNGMAQCALVLPFSASAVRGSVTVVSDGVAVSSRFSFRVR
jgi:hypothetical protein